MIDPEGLEDIRKRAEAATYGGWSFVFKEDFITDDNDGDVVFSLDMYRKEDAQFIAHARTDVPALLATIAEVRAELVNYFDDIDLDYEGQPNGLDTMVRQAAGQLHESRSWASKETERANVAEHKNSQLRSRFALELAARTTPDMAELQRQANRITELEESAKDERWMVETLAKALRVDLGAHCLTELVHAAAGRIEKLKKINGGLRKWQDVERPKLVSEVERLRVKVREAKACFEIECPCCGQLAASWAASDGDDLECGCDGQISACSETAPYANAYDCDCGGKGRPPTPKDPS